MRTLPIGGPRTHVALSASRAPASSPAPPFYCPHGRLVRGAAPGQWPQILDSELSLMSAGCQASPPATRLSRRASLALLPAAGLPFLTRLCSFKLFSTCVRTLDRLAKADCSQPDLTPSWETLPLPCPGSLGPDSPAPRAPAPLVLARPGLLAAGAPRKQRGLCDSYLCPSRCFHVSRFSTNIHEIIIIALLLPTVSHTPILLSSQQPCEIAGATFPLIYRWKN